MGRRHRLDSVGGLLVILGLCAALARLPLIRTPVDVSPDGCEYLGIARHIAWEGQWIASLKWHFFTDGPVVHGALADRPPLYPLWAAVWVAFSQDPETQVWLVRFANLLLAAVVPALIYWALRVAVSATAAAVAAAVFMLYPAFLRISAQPLTEPLFLVLVFGSLGLFLRAFAALSTVQQTVKNPQSAGAPSLSRSSRLRWVAIGFLAGLAVLTRPSGLLLPLVYGGALLFNGSRIQAIGGSNQAALLSSHPHTRTPEHRPSCWLPLGLLLLGCVLPLVPYWIAVTVQTGSPFTSVLRYNYSIRHIKEGTFEGFERSFPAPAAFVRAHSSEIVDLVARQWATMGSALGRSLQFALPLLLFWRPNGTGASQGVLFGLALLNFLFHAMSWTVWGAARYLFPTYIIGIALLVDAPSRWAGEHRARRWVAAGAIALAVALTLAVCLEQDRRLFQDKSKPHGRVPMGWAYAAAAERLSVTPPRHLSAANQPWIVNLLARRPAVMAPRFQDVGQLRRYLNRFRPATLTLFVQEREPDDVAAAHRLVDDLWTRPRPRTEVAALLDLEWADRRRLGPERQALLMFRVRSPREEVNR